MQLLLSTEIADPLSFVGGWPVADDGLIWPCTPETEEPMAFLFQFRIVKDNFPDRVMHVFHSIDVFDEDHVIPEYSSGEYSRTNPDSRNIVRHQYHFKVVFSDMNEDMSAVSGPSDIEKQYLNAISGESVFGAAGTEPDWVLEQETPLDYNGMHKFRFVLQIKENFKFKKSKNARKQKYISYAQGGKIIEKESNYYEFFALNEVYFFVCQAHTNSIGLIVVQS